MSQVEEKWPSKRNEYVFFLIMGDNRSV